MKSFRFWYKKINFFHEDVTLQKKIHRHISVRQQMEVSMYLLFYEDGMRMNLMMLTSLYEIFFFNLPSAMNLKMQASLASSNAFGIKTSTLL